MDVNYLEPNGVSGLTGGKGCNSLQRVAWMRHLVKEKEEREKRESKEREKLGNRLSRNLNVIRKYLEKVKEPTELYTSE